MPAQRNALKTEIVELDRLLKVCNRVVDGASDQIAWSRLAGAVEVLSAGFEKGAMLASEAFVVRRFGKTMAGEPATNASLQSKITEVTDMILRLVGDAKLARALTPKAIARVDQQLHELSRSVRHLPGVVIFSRRLGIRFEGVGVRVDKNMIVVSVVKTKNNK